MEHVFHHANLQGTGMSLAAMFRLDNRIAVVTGGGGRIGSGICEALAEAGAMVICANRNIERSEAVVSRVRAAGGKATAFPLDLADDRSINGLRNAVSDRFGPATVLVNNAISNIPGHVERYSREDWEASMNVDATGYFRITQLFLNDMLANGGGSIITIASILGMVSPDPRLYPTGMDWFRPNYFYAKAGVVGFTRFLAAAYAERNIRVNCISPGGIEMDPPRKGAEGFIDRTPMKRLGTPDDLKGAVVFLASDASSFVTGHNLVVDGGYTVW
jgi:NAD(P)-dependent dehydrogenase (short-subunit alcohol dehydrogenase family)